MLTHTARLVAEIMNLSPSERAPFVGNSAFAHKGGMHIDGVIKHSATFEQIPPESVGNQRRFIMSDQAGRAAVYARLSHIIPDVNRDSADMQHVIARLKEKEARGYTYENADGSFTELYTNITESDFNVFSVYLKEQGAELEDYKTDRILHPLFSYSLTVCHLQTHAEHKSVLFYIHC